MAERTKELQLEKAKTEELIGQMLPRQVADNLKNGLPVEPETFAMVTIFFRYLANFQFCSLVLIMILVATTNSFYKLFQRYCWFYIYCP